MATIIPQLSEILNSDDKPSSGEKFLLEKLNEILDDDDTIFYHPFVNGDRLDLVVLRRHYGVLVIEEKDWCLDDFDVINPYEWQFKVDGRRIKSPFAQVNEYKQNFYEVHVPELYERKLLNYNHVGIVQCAVYFSNTTDEKLREFIDNSLPDELVSVQFNNEKAFAYCRFNFENVNVNGKLLLNNLNTYGISNVFDKSMYENFNEVLNPRTIISKQGIRIGLTDDQNKNAVSRPGESKMKGYAGSGKTVVIAQRAINAHLRTKNRVLILCFNITLKNFIQERIGFLAEEYNKSYFYVDNYHQFILKVLNYLNIPVEPPGADLSPTAVSNYFEREYFSNIKLFHDNYENIRKYEVIIIDEVQDYKKEWMDIIKKYFLAKGGEYFVVGDAKQNIYNNNITGKDFTTNVPGDFRKLKKCWRSDPVLLTIFEQFQSKFLDSKYEHDELSNQLLPELFEKQKSHIDYLEFPVIQLKEILNYISLKSKMLKSKLEDIVILSDHIDLLRRLEAYFRLRSGKPAMTTFETSEQYLKLLIGIILSSNKKLSPEINSLNTLYFEAKEFHRNKLAELITLKALSSQYDDKNISQKIWKVEGSLQKSISTRLPDFVKLIRKKDEFFTDRSTRIHFETALEKLRQNKKNFFSISDNHLNFSTIHSFKGWEAENVFVLLDKDLSSKNSKEVFNELIYTALTRAKSNLFILNIGNQRLAKMVPFFVGGLESL